VVEGKERKREEEWGEFWEGEGKGTMERKRD
jgi:hypothetical protein